MIVVFSLMRRREDVTLTEFQRHWLDPHGKLVCKFPRLRRYSQNHVTGVRAAAAVPGCSLMPPAAVDGFAELSYDNDSDQETATGSPEMAACDRDSPRFIGSVLRVVTEDRVIIPNRYPTTGPANQIPSKQITVFTGGVDAASSVLPRFAEAVRRAAGVTGHVENLALRQRGPRSSVPVLDAAVEAIVEVWFASAVLMQHAAASLDAAAGKQAATYVVIEHRFI